MRIQRSYSNIVSVIIICLLVAASAGTAQDKLLYNGIPITYTGSALQENSIPIGGIGTGPVSLGGRGLRLDKKDILEIEI